MPRAAGTPAETLAFVESPVQLLNVLEWAYADVRRTRGSVPRPAPEPHPTTPWEAEPVGGPAESRPSAAADDGAPAVGRRTDPGYGDGSAGAAPAVGDGREPAQRGRNRAAGDRIPAGDGHGSPAGGRLLPAEEYGRPVPSEAHPEGAGGPADGGSPGAPGAAEHPASQGAYPASGEAHSGLTGAGGTAGDGLPGALGAAAPPAPEGAYGGPGALAPRGYSHLTVVVLSPHDPMTRGQLRRMAELARDEGVHVRWEDARGGAGAPLRTIGGLSGPLRRAERIVIGDPFSRYVQLLLTLTRARDLVVVDDGTATMEFISQLASGEPLVRWHRRGNGRGPRDMVFAPVSASARRKLTPGGDRRVEVFSSMPVEPPEGVTVTANDFAWTRARFGPPRLTRGTDLVGTSLVETGVVDLDRYLEAVGALARTHGATRYFAHRRESTEKLRRVSAELGLEVVRPELPLELIARRGPIGRTIVSFPSTVVHTLPLALVGTGVRVAVCDVDPAWLTEKASPRAQGFLSGVTGSARDVHRLRSAPTTAPS
ncbi:hypothetical protein ACZ90_31275 [Streptomyces albus subsp. albus]|nr:hypothetical protein ACZ90_31275 [Streptomyces albus subsp. albus]